ncbi:MAG TPA: alpha/beta hydrolase [Bryobacteraceae bacterium]|nr:alpha/beta hydrolase [Bryobacteraceae bacterium]
MTSLYKTAESERVIRERYLQFLKYWPVPNQQLRVPTREGETFIVACGDEKAPPLLLFHGAVANSSMWMGDVARWAAHFRVYAVDMIGEPGLSAPSRPPLASEAHALWLDDVIEGLSVSRASLVGISLGGWLALDYATRRPERVAGVAVLCPAGVGRQKIGTALKVALLSICGAWGKRKAREMILGRAPSNPSPGVEAFINFMLLIQQNFRPRMVKLPIFRNDALARLTMPVLAILGGKDVLLDSEETKRRLQATVPHAEIRWLAETGHLIAGQTAPILEFLRRPAMMGGSPCHEPVHTSNETHL